MGQSTQEKDAAKFTRSQLGRIWKALKEEDWLRLPGSGNLAFRRNKPDDLLGLCPHPNHADTTPSFHIYPVQGHGYCYGCGYRPTDPVELVSHISKISYIKALELIQNTCPKVPGIQGAHFRTFVEQQQITQEIKSLFKEVCQEQLKLAVAAYAANLKIQSNPKNVITDDDLGDYDLSLLGNEPDYPGEFAGDEELPDNVISFAEAKDALNMGGFDYATKTIHWLVDTRKIPLQVVSQLPIGILPPTSHIPTLAKKIIDSKTSKPDTPVDTLLQFLKIFLEHATNKNVVTTYTGAVVFPLHTTESNLAAFRLRQPNDVGTSKKISLIQDEYNDTVGFFGLDFKPYTAYFQNSSNHKQKSYVLVEGEFDALQVMVQAILSGEVTTPVISAGGNSAVASFDTIVILNDIKNLYLMGDSPKKGAVDTSLQVVNLWLKNIRECSISIFSEEGWDKLNEAEDLDDAYAHAKVLPETIADELNNIQNYIPAWRWVYNQTVPRLLEHRNDDVSAITAIIEEYGKTLLRNDDIITYIKAFCDQYPLLNQGRLKRGIMSPEDTERAFVSRIANAITDTYSVIGSSRDLLRGEELCLFRPKNKDKGVSSAYVTSIRVDSDSSIISELAKSYGPPLKFLTEVVGLPSFIDPSETAQVVNPVTGKVHTTRIQPLVKYDKMCRTYIKNAILELVQEAPNMDNLKKIRNGYHYSPDNELLVNGEDAFAIQRKDGALSFHALNSPRVNNILIDVYSNTSDKEHRASWFRPGTLTTEILTKAQGYDLKQTFETLRRFFDTGFVFEHQETTCQFLAALALTFPIMSCFDRQLVIHFTGDTSSGKTSLLGVFSNGKKDKPTTADIQIVFTSRHFLKVTTAAFIRAAANTSLLHCIDELEFDNEKNKVSNDSIMESLRGIPTGGGNRTVSNMGGDGTTTQNYNVPVIFASIMGTDKSQDLNRIIQVRMKKKLGQIDPCTAIHSVFSPDEIYDLQLAVNFGLYSHIPQILKNYEEIKKSYFDINSSLPFTVEQRFLSAFYPLFAVMKTIEIDYIEFMRNYVECNRPTITRNTEMSDHDLYLTKIFNNSVIKLQNYKDTYQCQSLARILTNRVTRHELNDAGVGVFYDEAQNLILLHVEQVLMHLMPAQSRNSGTTAMQLRSILERHPAALTTAEVKASGILQRATVHIGVGLKEHHVVVLHGEHWLENKRQDPTNTPITTETEDPQPKEPISEPATVKNNWDC